MVEGGPELVQWGVSKTKKFLKCAPKASAGVSFCCEPLYIRLSLVAFQLWRVLKVQKSDKNAKNALTSHYANGHGDPCDKWVIATVE